MLTPPTEMTRESLAAAAECARPILAVAENLQSQDHLHPGDVITGMALAAAITIADIVGPDAHRTRVLDVFIQHARRYLSLIDSVPDDDTSTAPP